MTLDGWVTIQQLSKLKYTFLLFDSVVPVLGIDLVVVYILTCPQGCLFENVTVVALCVVVKSGKDPNVY